MKDRVENAINKVMRDFRKSLNKNEEERAFDLDDSIIEELLLEIPKREEKQCSTQQDG